MCILLFDSEEIIVKLGKTVTSNVFLDHNNLMWTHSVCRSKEESRGSILGDFFPLQTELATKGNGTPAKQSILSVVLSEALV